jgi:hypothetical protein
MHPHVAEILPEARLHEGTRGGVQRVTRRAQHFTHDWRNFSGLAFVGRFALNF